MLTAYHTKRYYDCSSDCLFSFFQRPCYPFWTLVEEVRVVDFWAGCDRINDQVLFNILAAVELAWFWILVLHAIYAWQLSKKQNTVPRSQLRNIFWQEVQFQFTGLGCLSSFCSFLIGIGQAQYFTKSQGQVSAKTAPFLQKF